MKSEGVLGRKGLMVFRLTSWLAFSCQGLLVEDGENNKSSPQKIHFLSTMLGPRIQLKHTCHTVFCCSCCGCNSCVDFLTAFTLTQLHSTRSSFQHHLPTYYRSVVSKVLSNSRKANGDASLRPHEWKHKGRKVLTTSKPANSSWYKMKCELKIM